MATTTPNYGWTVPTSTDLVKDGATAIETLGDAIDASMNTALGTKKAGMVLLNTTSFSAVASQSISDVFSTTYSNYKIVTNITSTPTAGETLRMRLRVSGADNTSSNYRYLMKQVYAGGFDELSSTGATEWIIHRYTRADGYYGELNFDNPFATAYTGIYATGYTPNYNVTEGSFVYASTTVTTSYTGFTIYTSAGNMTGTISVYGVNK
jgi:hypothetical protein